MSNQQEMTFLMSDWMWDCIKSRFYLILFSSVGALLSFVFMMYFGSSMQSILHGICLCIHIFIIYRSVKAIKEMMRNIPKIPSEKAWEMEWKLNNE